MLMDIWKNYKNQIAQRGLQLGDPLSLFLFTVGDAFSNIVRYCNERRMIKGFSLGNQSTEAMHLKCADDIFIFCSWCDENLRAWWSIVNLFLLGSGLSLNASKTSLIGINLSDDKVASSASAFLLGCKSDKLPFIYSGSP